MPIPHHTGELFRRLGRCDKTADAPLLDLIRLELAVTKTVIVVRSRFALLDNQRMKLSNAVSGTDRQKVLFYGLGQSRYLEVFGR